MTTPTAECSLGGGGFRIALVCLVVLIDFLGMTMALNIIPILTDPSSSAHLEGCETMSRGAAYSTCMLSYAVGMTFSPAALGRLSDKLGRRPLLLVSMAIITLAYLLQAITNSFWWFVVLRILNGLAGGGRPVAMAYVADTVSIPSKQRAYLGYMNMIPGLCMAAGPGVGGLLSILGLRAPFYATAMVAAVVTVLIFLDLPESHHPRDIMAHQTDGPLLQQSAVERVPWRAFSVLYFTAMMSGFINSVVSVATPLLLKDSFNMTPVLAGITYLGDGSMIILGSYIFVFLSGRAGHSAIAVVTASIAMYGLTSLLLPLIFGYPWIFLAIKWVLLGITTSSIYSALPGIVVVLAPHIRKGEMMGYMSFSQGIGRLVGTGLAGPSYDLGEAVPFLLGAAGALLAAGACTTLQCCDLIGVNRGPIKAVPQRCSLYLKSLVSSSACISKGSPDLLTFMRVADRQRKGPHRFHLLSRPTNPTHMLCTATWLVEGMQKPASLLRPPSVMSAISATILNLFTILGLPGGCCCAETIGLLPQLLLAHLAMHLLTAYLAPCKINQDMPYRDRRLCCNHYGSPKSHSSDVSPSEDGNNHAAVGLCSGISAPSEIELTYGEIDPHKSSESKFSRVIKMIFPSHFPAKTIAARHILE